MKVMKIASVGACSILLGWATAVAAAETSTKTTHSPEFDRMLKAGGRKRITRQGTQRVPL